MLRPMTRGARALAAATIACSVIGGACAEPGRMPQTRTEAEALVREHVAEGADLAAVRAFLNARGIEHAYSKTERRIVSVVRAVSSDSAVTTSIQMTFTFDADGRLESFVAREVFVAPP